MSGSPEGALPAHVAVAIVGTGFSGLGMAIALQKAGFTDFLLLERADAVGGTWRDNHYPGCACDVPSYLYSYSFEPSTRWSRVFAPHDEIRAYLDHCADKYGLRPRIRFGREVSAALFDDARGVWRITLTSGESLTASSLVLGIGALSNPLVPEIPGSESFKGARFHSAQWDHAYDLTGKRVAVLGTGASAIQFVPAIQPQVARLDLFQRTPPWVMPKADGAISPAIRQLFDRHPLLATAYRGWIYGAHEARALGMTRHPDWMKLAAWLGRKHIAAHIQDPELRRKLTPTYMPGCKRILLSNDYYPSLAKPNVAVHTEHVAALTETGVRTADGREYPVDAVIYGTGFRVHDYVGRMSLHGLGGRDLGAEWRTGAEAYLGITVSGYPNLFMLMGPNTGLGHNSMVYMIESQIHYVLECLRYQREHGYAWADVRADRQRTFVDEMQQRLRDAVWNTGCSSWYLTESGRNSTLWPGFTFEYRNRTRRFDPDAYTLGHRRPVDASGRPVGAPAPN